MDASLTVSQETQDYQLSSLSIDYVYHSLLVLNGLSLRLMAWLFCWWLPSPLGLKFRSSLSDCLSTPSSLEEAPSPSATFYHRRSPRNAACELNMLLKDYFTATTRGASVLTFVFLACLESYFPVILSPNGISIPQYSSALISKNNNPRTPRAMDDNVQRKNYDHRKPNSTEIVCNYCHEYAKFQNYLDSLQASSSSTPVASTVALGNIKCLLTSSTKWVIDSGAITHMTSNSRLFSRPLSPAPFPSVTLADGSTSFDHVTKKIIGRGYESGGLYLFDHQVPQAVVCLVVPSPFEVHCRLGHPSLFVLKKLYPEFSAVQHNSKFLRNGEQECLNHLNVREVHYDANQLKAAAIRWFVV
ncbi:gag-pol polyprotein [Cucumis melo var. makuwa]|uniref:Gag-pol polyprotein n=1 Tax=Cucumis melo var. makuwa TaxID=1194695 RepID=A0A5A7URE2_CUCMM|nr:gag-pol polyprotein [Cucumis melo var. makuwa]TYJ96426.1 gag-pol polyprotein [Cucumis melo var. makuwa]